jgi:hypothetical protein
VRREHGAAYSTYSSTARAERPAVIAAGKVSANGDAALLVDRVAV